MKSNLLIATADKTKICFPNTIQVVSPITGKEIGMLEMRVAKNRETIRGMNVRILSGLRLEVQADPTDQGRYTLKTAYSQLLRSKYQVCMTRVHRYMTLYMRGGRNPGGTCLAKFCCLDNRPII